MPPPRRVHCDHGAQRICVCRHLADGSPHGGRAYVGAMSETPAFLDGDRPPVPDIVVPRGVTPFYLPAPPGARPPGAARAAGACAADPAPQPSGGDPARRPVAGAGGGAVHRAEVPRLVQRAGEGRRRRCRCCWPTAPTPARCAAMPAPMPKKLEELLRDGSIAGGRPAARRRLSRLHRRPGAGPEPPPGHRHHRGRQPGRDGAALLPHQRAASLLRASRLRRDRGRLARRRAGAGEDRRRRRHRSRRWTTMRRRRAGAPRRYSPPH